MAATEIAANSTSGCIDGLITIFTEDGPDYAACLGRCCTAQTDTEEA